MIISSVIDKSFQTLSTDVTILDAIHLMSVQNDGFVVFSNEHNEVVGVLTERDLVHYILQGNQTNQNAYFYAKKNVITFKENRTIEYVLLTLLEFSIRRVIVVDKQNKFVGITTQEKLIHCFDDEAFKVKMKINQILDLHPLITLKTGSKLHEAFELMKNNNIGSVVITDDEKPIGIITERDSVRFIHDKIDLDTKVDDVMSAPVIFTHHDDTVEHALSIMDQHNIQRILVEHDNNFTILGIRDILHVVNGNYGTLLEKKYNNPNRY